MLNCDQSVAQIKNMEGQHKLVGPQRPSTHGRLFASLPITRNLIYIDRRFEVGFRAVEPSYCPTQANRLGTRNLEPTLQNAPMGAPAREQRATSQSLPTSIGMKGCAGLEPTAGSLEIATKIDRPSLLRPSGLLESGALIGAVASSAERV